jgi:hypothetical protein
MTTTEMREFDAWIAVNLFGYEHRQIKPCAIFPDGGMAWHNGNGAVDYLHGYTTDPAAAMEVLKKCADKVSKIDNVCLCVRGGKWSIWYCDGDAGTICESESKTIELAICKFAKKLFGKDKE